MDTTSILFNTDEIRRKLKLKKKKLKISNRKICDETGISDSSISRFLTGRGNLCFDHLYVIATWCGIPISEDKVIFNGNTTENVKRVIENDPYIPEENKETLWNLFSSMYECLRREECTK